MSNQINWNPIYIRTVLADKPKYRIDSDYWNALWNSAIEQGDNNTEGVLLLKTEVEVLIEQFAEMLDTGTGIVAVATQQANLAQGHQRKAEEAAEQAQAIADDSERFALNAQSWAKGGTGSRAGEDTDNAKYYSEQIAIVAEDVAEQKSNFDAVANKALSDITQIVEEAENSLENAIAAQNVVFEEYVTETTSIKEEAVKSKTAAKSYEDAAKAAQVAAEKARDEAQAAVGGDFVTNEEFEDGIKNFVTNSSMEAYVDSVMKVDDSTEV